MTKDAAHEPFSAAAAARAYAARLAEGPTESAREVRRYIIVIYTYAARTARTRHERAGWARGGVSGRHK